MSEPRPTPDAPQPDADPILANLRELAELGMTLARATVHRAVAAPEPHAADATPDAGEAAAPQRDPNARYERLARSIRLTLTLEAKLREARRARLDGDTARAEAARAGAEADADDPNGAVTPFRRVRQGRRGMVRQRMVDVIDRESPDPDEHEILTDTLDERLLWDPAYADLDDKPLRDIVEHLCADLKLKPDWRRWQGDGWKTEPFFRPRCSPFHQRSSVPILDDDDPDPRE